MVVPEPTDIEAQAMVEGLSAYVEAGGKNLVRAAKCVEEGIELFGPFLRSVDPLRRKKGLRMMRERGLTARVLEM